MVYCFDIDGVICTNTEGEYLAAKPCYDVIAEVNRLHSEGNTILLYTARGATTGIEWREATERQLAEWNVRYHTLFMGKPTAHVYIDDKAINSVDWKRSGFQAVLPAPENANDIGESHG